MVCGTLPDLFLATEVAPFVVAEGEVNRPDPYPFVLQHLLHQCECFAHLGVAFLVKSVFVLEFKLDISETGLVYFLKPSGKSLVVYAYLHSRVISYC